MSSFMLDSPVRPAPGSASTRVGRPDMPPAIGPGAYRRPQTVLDGVRPPDAWLLEQARNGDARAFETVYDRHVAAAYGLARRMLHSPGAAQDVVQEAFLSLWRTDTYRVEKGSVRTFL